MIGIEPALIHAVINWKMDDWESGLSAATHTGNREVAELLLGRGARMDIFAAAMLGELPIVKAMIKRQPSVLHTAGPPLRIPLIRHAEMGGKQAQTVLEYLLQL